LRKQRFKLGIRQSEAALRLGVSKRTLSLWETDLVYPTWAYQPRLAAYLGCDPFTDPALGCPKGNETQFVAILAPTGPLTLGQRIIARRVELRKNRTECAQKNRGERQNPLGLGNGPLPTVSQSLQTGCGVPRISPGSGGFYGQPTLTLAGVNQVQYWRSSDRYWIASAIFIACHVLRCTEGNA